MTIGCFITIAVLVFIDSIVEQLPKTIKGIVKRVAKLMIIVKIRPIIESPISSKTRLKPLVAKPIRKVTENTGIN